MNAAVAPRVRSLPTGLGVSILVHVLLVAYLITTFSHPMALAPPTDLSSAIPISMEPFRPKPPPEPPKPEPKPDTPKDVVTTTAAQPTTEVAEAPAEPSPPTPPQASEGLPSPPAYASLVAGILARNKRYPKEALEKEQEGVVEAYFVVNHQGHVIGYRIERGSGVSVLDQEVVRLLKSVSFPPIPDDGGDPERREFRLPLTFKIEG